MSANWAAVIVAAAIGAFGLVRWSNRLSALLERLTIASERHDKDLAERARVDDLHDGQLRDLTSAIRALAESNGRPLP